ASDFVTSLVSEPPLIAEPREFFEYDVAKTAVHTSVDRILLSRYGPSGVVVNKDVRIIERAVARNRKRCAAARNSARRGSARARDESDRGGQCRARRYRKEVALSSPVPSSVARWIDSYVRPVAPQM